MLRCSTTGIVPCKIRGRARMAPASYCHFVCSVPGDPLCWNGMPFRGGMMPILEENDWLKRKNRSVLRTDRVMMGVLPRNAQRNRENRAIGIAT